MGGSGPSASVNRYDPAADTWTSVAPLPTARARLACAVVGGRIYAVGGGTSSTGMNTLEIYDPDADAWTEAGRMPTPRHGLEAVTIDDSIWTIAGASRAGGNETSAAVEVFRP